MSRSTGGAKRNLKKDIQAIVPFASEFDAQEGFLKTQNQNLYLIEENVPQLKFIFTVSPKQLRTS